MATQLAPISVVKGQAAKAILKEMQRKPSPASKQGAIILAEKFSKTVR